MVSPRVPTQFELQRKAQVRLGKILQTARQMPALRRLQPAKTPWHAEVRLVGTAAIQKLNHEYRRISKPTDVLSFGSPKIFYQQGILGELVICAAVLKQQAAEQEHSILRELDILLVHGVLHLLGLDHELGPTHAAKMARWEARLLGQLGRKSTQIQSPGLIARGG